MTQIPSDSGPDAPLRALLLTKDEGGSVTATLHDDLHLRDLPGGEVLVGVEASSLNYKDGLAVAGRPGVIRDYPMVPGIDLAGTVLESSDPRYAPGDAVLLTGWGVGERHWGGYASHARVKADWLVRRPDGMSARTAMSIGTAGFTAMLALMRLEKHGLTPGAGEVAVTGASGGVGSVAVALLSAAGYTVVASTGRAEGEGYLRALGASEVIGREVLPGLKRPLEKERFAAGVDSVGGATLVGLLASLKRDGAVAACGLAGLTCRAAYCPSSCAGSACSGSTACSAPPSAAPSPGSVWGSSCRRCCWRPA